VAKVYGEHVVCKLFDPLHNKSLPTLRPADDVIVFLVLNAITPTSKI
jgi:hypothetical protein